MATCENVFNVSCKAMAEEMSLFRMVRKMFKLILGQDAESYVGGEEAVESGKSCE